MMNRLFAIGLIFLLTNNVIAQSQNLGDAPMYESTSKMLNINSVASNYSPEGISAIDSLSIIWSDDFSTVSNWNVVGDTGEWNIVISNTNTLIAQGVDSAINSTSGGNFALIDSDQAGQSGSQDSYLEYAGTIDCSSHSGVRLQFETYFYQYQETREVLVSNDGGANWDVYPVLTGFGSNTSSSNPYVETVDISATAAGQVAVKVKFHYVGAWDWFWAIDDVSFSSIPDNDLVLNRVSFENSTGSISSNYYSRIPLTQSLHDFSVFSSEITNEGVVDQTNVRLHNRIVSPLTMSSMNSNPTSIVAGGLSTNTINGSYTFGNDGLGTYQMTFYVKSDSIDDNPNNDSMLFVTEVTDTVYSRDANTGSIVTWNSLYEVGSSYEIFDTCKVTSVSVGIDSATPIGAIVSLRIYDDNFNQIVSSEFVELTSNEIGQLASFSIPQTRLDPGKYIVSVATFTNDVVLQADSISVADPNSVFVDFDQSGIWSWINTIPVIRLNISDDLFICDLVSAAIQYGNNTAVVAVTNGVPPYVYIWSTGDTTYSSYPSDTISPVASGASYTVQVIDSNNCMDETIVDIVSGINDVENQKISIFPNPNNGVFQIEMNNIPSGEYQVIVRNILAQEIMTKTIFVNSYYNGSIQLYEIEKGMYFIEIRNSADHISMAPFILE